MKESLDIIMVGIQPWDISIGSNFKNMAIELARHHRVLYVNSPMDQVTLLRARNSDEVKTRRKVISGQLAPLQNIHDRLFILNPTRIINSINWLPKLLFSNANHYNNSVVAREIKTAIDQLNFKDYIIINDSDMFRSFYLKEMLRPKKYVYYTRDNLMTVPYWRKHGSYMEPSLMKKSDLVVGNSPYLIAQAKKHNPNSYYIGQGCDFSIYNAKQAFEKPYDLKTLKGKLLGYTGLLSSRRLDIELIKFLANSQPQNTIVLVGKEEQCFVESELHQIPNIKFLGNKSPEQLPQYIHFFDVCINPQIVNELTLANYPRKIDEYLSMGKPVVATYTPTMEIFEKHVHLARTKAEFCKMVDIALSDAETLKAEERINLAQTHTWEASVNILLTLIKKDQD